jgi:hypothetical protein
VEGVLRAMYDKPSLSLAIPRQVIRKEDTICHKLEAPKQEEKKKKGTFGAFSTLDYLPGCDNRDGTKTECTGVLTCTCVLL